jgi:hypothetical protein
MRRIAPVRLTERFDQLLDDLPDGWAEAVVRTTVADPADGDRAAAVLGPLAPGRSGAVFSVRVSRSGVGAPSVDAVRRSLDRLEAGGVDARVTIDAGTAAVRADDERRPLAGSWDELLTDLPADWSDLYLEVELLSSSDADHGALLLGPVNPLLAGGARSAFRFRAARRFGYGASPGMVRRSLERLDGAGITGRLRLLRVMSETEPVLTQGPVWREAGRAV